ncbi:hypothetical protein [Pedobacter sp. MC2016-24]|uniref:hypothetical protein n=1 Tax=Pedobacter sp. MC2016-24 TaxID=2780090 RepID=UPI0018816FB1|nr:hypothetical protein [Pedobacter sp. MC2016-24]MBE9598589.1 hypothetical protein [Pedobacter sp. MC2016-24]
MNTIVKFSLSIINQVKLRRLILGLSASQLSLLLEHAEAYVSHVESTLSQGQYPPHEYPKLAEALKCTVHDLLPRDDMEQQSPGELVDKVVLSLSNQVDLKKVIDGLIAYGFFDRPKTMDDVVEHLFIKKKEQVELLFEVLEGVVKEGSLKRRLLDYYRDIV